MEWEDADDLGLPPLPLFEEGGKEGGEDEENDEEDEDEGDEALRRFLDSNDDGGLVVTFEKDEKEKERDTDKANQKKHGLASRRTRKELWRDFRIHTAHLALLTHRAHLLSHSASHPSLLSAAAALVPSALRRSLRRGPSVSALARLLLWFNATYTQLPDSTLTEEEGREGSCSPRQLLEVVSMREGGGAELIQVLVATLRGVGVRARFVSPLCPRSYHHPPYLIRRRREAKGGKGGKGGKEGGWAIDLTQEEEEEEEEEGGAAGGKGRGRKGGRKGLKKLLSSSEGARSMPGCGVWAEVFVKGKEKGRGREGRKEEEMVEVGCSDDGEEKEDEKEGEEDGESTESENEGKGRQGNGKRKATKTEEKDCASSSSSSSSKEKRRKLSAELFSPSSSSSSSSLCVSTSTTITKTTANYSNNHDQAASVLPQSLPPSIPSSKGNDRWVALDVLRGRLDDPCSHERSLLSSRPSSLLPSSSTSQWLYVLGVDNEGWLTDVTRRYSTRWSRALRFRAGKWWAGYLERANSALAHRREARLLEKGDFRSFFEFETARDLERDELNEAETKEPMPTTWAGFEKHQKYVLERHLKRWEVIGVEDGEEGGKKGRRKVLGMFKGECVYDRRKVQEGATVRQWLQKHGRQVREGEKPCRIVESKSKSDKKKKKKTGNPGQEEEEEDGKEEGGKEGGKPDALELYGFWQTERYQPPALLPNGRIPVNEHGNIEVWNHNPVFLPKGTAHVWGEGGGEWAVAQKLGVRYARAVVGWEVRQGRTLPVVEGVVVRKEDEGVLRDGLRAWQVGKEEKAAKAKEKRVVERWARFVKGLRIARDLQRKYGEGGRGGGDTGSGDSEGVGGGGGWGRMDKKEMPK